MCYFSKQKGRDFSIILSCLNKLGYAVEWRIINAAEYGFPQRRRRVFIIGYHQKTTLFKTIKKTNPEDWILKDGVAAKAFPANKANNLKTGRISENKKEIMSSFLEEKSPFEKAGLMLSGNYYTLKVKPIDDKN